jgi:tetratricopeptide (TPR) repeat protein
MKKYIIPLLTIAVLISLQSDCFAMNKKALKFYQNGNKLYGISDYQGAKTQYKKALEKDSTDSIVYIKLAATLLELGEWEEAINIYKKALAWNPNDSSVYTSLGNIYQEHSMYEEALAAYNKSFELAPEYKFNF